MDGRAYYNEIDPYAAAWLRNLIAAGHIAPGLVDERSIVDVRPSDLAGFSQVHLFAGIGGWSLALRMAGWPDDLPVWTGSPPCQPFSIAAVAGGGGVGQADERHLAPEFIRLVGKCSPPIVFGEQVANAIRWGWLDDTLAALEGLGYACGAAVLPALSVGARHERKRVYWVADAGGSGRPGHQSLERIPEPAPATLAVYGDPLAHAGRALDGNRVDLLPGDGLSVVLERRATHAYGNAIVPPLAAEFIRAFIESEGMTNA